MRGQVSRQQALFVTISVEDRVPAEHPLRAVKRECDAIFGEMRRDFNAAYSPLGRPSIPPEQLLKALLLQALYSIRSEIQLMQAIDFNLLYRWFLDLPLDEPAWTPEVFSMNRQRFEKHGLLRKFFDRIVGTAIEGGAGERGPLHGGWHADPVVGQPQEPAAQGRFAAAADEGRR